MFSNFTNLPIEFESSRIKTLKEIQMTHAITLG